MEEQNQKHFLTIKGRDDGFGAQYQAIMSGIALAHFKQCHYYHTPFVGIHHVHGEENIQKMNHFIGIQNEIPYNEEIHGTMEVVMEFADAHYHCPHPSIYYTNSVLQQIRNWYHSTKKPIVTIDIAIHIRRGDVHSQWVERYTDNAIYIQLIQLLQTKYPQYKITIVSEGCLDDFKDFHLSDDCFLLNGDITIAFHTMVSSKILIMSKSSFSYTAALLNPNQIYYMNFWHKPLDHWLSINDLLK